MRACRERRSVVKHTFSRQSSPLSPATPSITVVARASKTFGCTKRVGGVERWVLKREGTRGLKSGHRVEEL